MSTLISCPKCGRSVNPHAHLCDHCGVEIGLAAAFAEHKVRESHQMPAGVSVAPEILVPRLGDYLIEMGLLMRPDLERALVYQEQQMKEGRPLLLGQALRELELIDHETLDQVITEQILQLQIALRQYNRQLEKRVQERTRELQLALEKLTELNQLKANFIANISHELRTPLTHIKGYLDILACEGLGPLNRDQIDALGVLLRAEGRLERLIEDLIQFSLVSRGELKLRFAPVNLREVIQAALDQGQYRARSDQLKIHVSIPEILPLVTADGEKVLWVVSQLLDNAIKFTKNGGTILAEAINDGKSVTVAVTDTGIGIPKERLKEIFEPFHQLDGSSTRHYSGTGLGLALCNRILEAHGSQLKVVSKVGGGSRFHFSLPIAHQYE